MQTGEKTHFSKSKLFHILEFFKQAQTEISVGFFPHLA